jgi:hypothetical protein
VTCSVPIYISGEFQSIWRPPSAGPNYLGFQSSSGAHHSVGDFRSTEIERDQSSSGAHHSVGDFRSTEIERDLGDSVTWVVLTITRSISWHIY